MSLAQLSIRSFFQANLPPQSQPSPALPPEASVRPILPSDIAPLRRLNSLLLPVSYQDSFYQRLADPVSGRFSRVITWRLRENSPLDEPTLIGAIVCRIDHADPNTLYIQSLALLSPYRSLGLAAAALDVVAHAAAHDPVAKIRLLTAHVWTRNDDALHWYQARGFERAKEPIDGYYLKLRPNSAWLVSRPAITTPATTTKAQSFQNQKPETEWNDLPDDMTPSLLAAPARTNSRDKAGSAASSRSSSSARKKRDRSYPPAAFGN